MQAYNGVLQSAPVILFTLLVGPATDKYGRKPLMLFSMAGYLLLNIILLINSIWFYQLKVGKVTKENCVALFYFPMGGIVLCVTIEALL